MKGKVRSVFHGRGYEIAGRCAELAEKAYR